MNRRHKIITNVYQLSLLSKELNENLMEIFDIVEDWENIGDWIAELGLICSKVAKNEFIENPDLIEELDDFLKKIGYN